MAQKLIILLFLILPFGGISQKIIQGTIEKKIAHQNFDKNFSEYQIFEINPNFIKKQLNNRNANQTIHLQIGRTYDWKINLWEHAVISENYSIQAITEAGTIDVPKSSVKAYRGLTQNKEEVRLTIDDDFLYGFITQNGERFFIEPAFYFDPKAKINQFVIYSEKDVIQHKGNTCALIDAEEDHTTNGSAFEESSVLTDGCAEIELAIASDYKMFQKYGSVPGVEAHNIGVMNNVQLNYDDEFAKEIRFKIVKQIVIACDGCDPWSATRGPGQVLDNFRQWGNQGGFGNTTYDLAQFWTNRDFNGGVIGIAYLLGRGVMCTSLRYHAIQDFSSNSSLVRVVVAHEIGHNLSARHSSYGYIMNSFVNNTNSWANSSINSINRAVQSKLDNGCLTECSPILPPDLGDPDKPLTLDFVDASPETCFQAEDGAITLSVSGGFPDYSYFWNVNGLEGDKVKNLKSGTYYCTIVDQNFASVVAGPIIIAGSNSPLTIQLDEIIPQSCDGGFTGGISITANGGTPPYFYNWSNGYLEDDISEIDAGTYAVTVLDAYGCFTVLDNLVIPAGAEPQAIVDPAQTINCNQQEVVLNGLASDHGTSNYFLWTTDNGNIVDGANTLTPTVNAPGAYTLTVFNGSDNCFSSTTVNVLEDRNTPDIQINEIETLNCNQSSVTLQSFVNNADNIAVQWSTTDGNILSGVDTQNPTVNQAGTYQLIVTNMNNGCQAEAQVVVNSNFTTPTIQLEKDASLDCNHTTATLTATVSDNSNYLWTTVDGHILDNPQNASIQVDQEGNYTFTATHNESGCTSQETINVSSNIDLPNINLGSIPQLDCNHPTVVINGNVNNSGDFEYQWSTSNGNILSSSESNILETDQPGAYTFSVTNTETGCHSESTITVTKAPELMIVVGNIVNNQCYGDQNGQAQVQIASGTSPYTFLWSNGMNQETAQNLAAGEYQVVVTDGAGCSMEQMVTITQPSELTASITANNGQLTANVDGGVAPYTYLWNDGATSESIMITNSGTYSVEISDANGCSKNVNYTVNNPECNISVTITTTDVSCFGQNDGTASVTINGGMGNISYQWSNDQTTKDIQSLSAGTYALTATDENDCQVVEEITITQPNELIISASKSNLLCYGDDSGAAQVDVEGGTGSISLQWSNDATTKDIQNLSAGIYSVTATDENDCQATQEITITQPEKLIASAHKNDILCNSDGNGAAEIIATGGTSPYNYHWNTDATSPKIGNLDGGTYSCEVTDNNGCHVTEVVEIEEPEMMTIKPLVTAVSVPNGSDGEIIIGINGGTEPYSYLWSNGNTTNHITGLKAGAYSVDVSDAHECMISMDFQVSEPGVVEIDLTKTDVSCYNENDGQAVVNVTQGEAPFTYSWSNGEDTKSITGLAPGNYSVTVTDSNGVTSTGSIDIVQPDNIKISLITHNVNCFGASDGSVEIKVQGGTEPYAVNWAIGTDKNLPAGTYAVTVVDAHNCKSTSNFVISSPDAIEISDTIVDTKPNQSIGSINITPTGGIAPYSFEWSNGATTEDIENLSAGDYTVVITDKNDCTVEKTFTVQELVGTNEILTDQNLSIHPNPSNGDFILDMHVNTKKPVQIQIYNVTGQTISANIQQISKNEKYQIELSPVAGVYFIKLRLEDEVLVKKLVVE